MSQSPLLIHNLPRRHFLKLGIAAAGAATAASVFLSGSSNVSQQTDLGVLLVFDLGQAYNLHSFAELVVPQGEGWPTSKEAQVVTRLDEELYFLSEDVRDNILLALDTLEYLPLSQGFFSRYSKMNFSERQEFLSSVEDTRSDLIRLVISGLRMLCLAMYYGHASTWQSIGYDGSFAKLPPQLSVQRDHYASQTLRIVSNSYE